MSDGQAADQLATDLESLARASGWGGHTSDMEDVCDLLVFATNTMLESANTIAGFNAERAAWREFACEVARRPMTWAAGRDDYRLREDAAYEVSTSQVFACGPHTCESFELRDGLYTLLGLTSDTHDSDEQLLARVSNVLAGYKVALAARKQQVDCLERIAGLA